jgi:hypothetical protein
LRAETCRNFGGGEFQVGYQHATHRFVQRRFLGPREVERRGHQDPAESLQGLGEDGVVVDRPLDDHGLRRRLRRRLSRRSVAGRFDFVTHLVRVGEHHVERENLGLGAADLVDHLGDDLALHGPADREDRLVVEVHVDERIGRRAEEELAKTYALVVQPAFKRFERAGEIGGHHEQREQHPQHAAADRQSLFGASHRGK